MTTADLPTLNATLNSVAALLLLSGYLAIRRGKRELHAKLMTGAFLVSTAFLISYITYHATTLHTKYEGEGAMRTVYLVVLVSHIILAVAVVPLVLITMWRARKKDFARHRRIARITFPIWVYVSVTGVLVYLMLYRL
ncbi:MAG: DUF420 domain-containing protein [Planctomycetota bacterium]